nr:hypothetical protein CFP56_78714 [Quercus suber]
MEDPPAKNIFSLPQEIRDSIYTKVVAVRNPLDIFQDPGCPLETFAPERPRRWTALLYTNKQMSREASAVLYGKNVFKLVDATLQHVRLMPAFLECIGPVNASSLSHLCIDYPLVEGEAGKFKLRDDHLNGLHFLQDRCTSLLVLELLLHGRESVHLTNANHDNSRYSTEALSQLDTRLRNITSLQKIIVRVYSGKPILPVMESMHNLGWAVLPANRDHW